MGVPARDPRTTRRHSWILPVLALMATVACSATTTPPPARPGNVVVVASFNFDESRLLAEIYAQAIEGQGIDVRRELDLGPRELVLPALRQGLVDVVPEYLGTLVDATAPSGPDGRTDVESLRTRLDAAVAPWGLQALDLAAASNQNALVVTRATAEDAGLRSISDLAPIADGLILGGPPECPVRPRCLVGLQATYGLDFAGFLALDGARLVRQALLDGVIDVGVLFTTDGYLAGADLTVLADDRSLQPAENVLPLVRRDALARESGITILDAVSAALTTDTLRFLNWRVTVAGGTPAAEARGWLLRHELIER